MPVSLIAPIPAPPRRYLSARDLLREENYSLAHLAKASDLMGAQVASSLSIATAPSAVATSQHTKLRAMGMVELHGTILEITSIRRRSLG